MFVEKNELYDVYLNYLIFFLNNTILTSGFSLHKYYFNTSNIKFRLNLQMQVYLF